MVLTEHNPESKLMIIAGEASGDLIGASLIKEMKKLSSEIKIFGIGGEKMQMQGMNLSYHIKDMAFLGFTEVVKHLPFIKKVQKNLIEIVKAEKIKTVVLIDYPGFNLSIAKKFKEMGMKVVYYISPQLWAWGKRRMKKVKKLIDKMLVVFPFEENLYKSNEVNVEFVGHPLIERVSEHKFLSRDELYNKFNLKKEKEILLLLPGSRKHEINDLFPSMMKAAKRIAEKFNMEGVVACSSNIDKKLFEMFDDTVQFKIIEDHTYDLMKYAKFGIIKSGTSTLEAGYFALPMVIVYKTSFITYLIGKNLVRLDNIGMANIILEEKVVPELIQDDVNENKIYRTSFEILNNEEKYSLIKSKLGKIKARLGTKGASMRAAKSILAVMNEA
ncbi:lipid-A-disaccharide synthase [bacterium BMS3Abin03]|nr:lipid-A-disaccharide synthase [bacterium BMS3Abin03]HDH07706.1 lipid-A-disaccharide synthase [Candidatus Moranbacteria bacterium]